MGSLRCVRCGDLFETDSSFMTANVEVQSASGRETLAQLVFCSPCADLAEDTLSFETARQRR